MSSLISHEQLRDARRLLYMSHLAIGDYLYQGVWLQALKTKYPNLTVDVWFDDCRRRPHGWAAGRNRTLGQWLRTDGSFDTLYPIVANLDERKARIAAAGAREYDLIAFVGKNRSEQFAKIARRISHSAFIVATRSKPFNNPLAKWWHFSRLDGYISFDEYAYRYQRITEIYANIFRKVFGLTREDTNGRGMLEIRIEQEYAEKARAFLNEFGDGPTQRSFVFTNHLSTAARKDYPWEKLRDVLLTLGERFENLAFVVNCPPDRYEDTSAKIRADAELNTLAINAFTAKESFFELPAVMSECDFVIGVDTATSHLAAALGKPQVAIMADDVKLWQPPGDSLILEGTGRASSVTPSQVVEAFTRQSTR